jgi:large subunit ribosomal protein L3
MKGILGKKLGMTQVFTEDGRLVPVTVVEAGPARVIQKKEKDIDGYDALQMGFEIIRKEKNVTKPMLGHFGKTKSPAFRFLKEIRMDGFDTGEEVKVDIFTAGERVSVTGTSKGKGFQGVMKRYNFRGGPATHGSMFNRAPGSMGQSSFPSRVFKGKELPGHMGAERVTTKNMEVFDIKKEQNLILIKGAVPGAKGGYVLIQSDAPVAAKED